MATVSVTPTEHTSNMSLETLHKIQQQYQTKTPLTYKVRKDRALNELLRNFNIKKVISNKSKPPIEPNKRHSKTVPIYEPVQDKAKNKRKRQLTLSEQFRELEIRVYGIEKFNRREEMTKIQRLESNIIKQSNSTTKDNDQWWIFYNNTMQKDY